MHTPTFSIFSRISFGSGPDNGQWCLNLHPINVQGSQEIPLYEKSQNIPGRDDKDNYSKNKFYPFFRYVLLHFSPEVHTQETACSEQDSKFPVWWRNSPVYGDETIEGDAGRRGGKCAQ